MAEKVMTRVRITETVTRVFEVEQEWPSLGRGAMYFKDDVSKDDAGKAPANPLKGTPALERVTSRVLERWPLVMENGEPNPILPGALVTEPQP
jgi:hypothetical protein